MKRIESTLEGLPVSIDVRGFHAWLHLSMFIVRMCLVGKSSHGLGSCFGTT